jgi:hypothetical protein
MRVGWEDEDIKPGRRFKGRSGSEVWMIGYICDEKENIYTVISLSDGLVNSKLKTRSEVAGFLNKNSSLPLELTDESWRKEIAQ